MAKAKKTRRKPSKGVSQPCQKMHVDTEDRADAMMAVLKKQYPGGTAVKQYDMKCKSWHVGMVR